MCLIRFSAKNWLQKEIAAKKFVWESQGQEYGASHAMLFWGKQDKYECYKRFKKGLLCSHIIFFFSVNQDGIRIL